MFKNQLMNIALIVLAGYVILSMMNSKSTFSGYGTGNLACNASPFTVKEKFQDMPTKAPTERPTPSVERPTPPSVQEPKVQEPSVQEPRVTKPVENKSDISSVTGATGCETEDRLQPAELLPKGENTDWGKSSPDAPGGFDNPNLIDAGYHIGRDTVSNNLRNASRDLRCEPPNPTTKVSPWMMSTIGPDLSRKGLNSNCGSC